MYTLITIKGQTYTATVTGVFDAGKNVFSINVNGTPRIARLAEGTVYYNNGVRVPSLDRVREVLTLG